MSKKITVQAIAKEAKKIYKPSKMGNFQTLTTYINQKENKQFITF